MRLSSSLITQDSLLQSQDPSRQIDLAACAWASPATGGVPATVSL